MNRSFSALFVLALVVCSVLADTFTVNVAPGGANTYNPSTVNAKVGDVVQFSFQSGRNSVVQASNSTSCIPLAGGFDSTVKNSGDTYSLTLTDALAVIYYYNSVNNLCSGGMRGTINVQGGKNVSTNSIGGDGNSTSSGSSGSGGGSGGGSSAATSSTIVSYGVLVLSAIVAVLVSF